VSHGNTYSSPRPVGFKVETHFLLMLTLIRLGLWGPKHIPMAKDSHGLANGFDAENTGGALSGLLAEEDEFDRRTLWRLGSWAVASIGAVIVAILANQSSIGMRREQIASADLARQSQQMQSIARENQNEARRLASAIETLNGDRDRLYSRLGILEQGFESVTGTVARQNSAGTPSQGATSPTAAPALSAGPAPSPTASAASTSAPAPPALAAVAAASETLSPAQKPAPTPVAAAPAASAEKPATLAKASEKPPAAIARAEPGPTATPSEPPAIANTPTSLMASKSMMAPPDPAAPKLLEPMQPPKIIMAAPMPEIVASVPPNEEDTETDSAANVPKPSIQRTEFGVDLGGANSIPGLRALWRGLLKSRSNAALIALRPIIVIKEGSNGLGMQLRLVAGPISDAAAAAKICASMIASERPCTTAIFEGQRLALNPEETGPTEIKPAVPAKPSPQRRSNSRRPPVAEEPAAKPESSTLSSFFSR
jgi:hypothetical protein